MRTGEAGTKRGNTIPKKALGSRQNEEKRRARRGKGKEDVVIVWRNDKKTHRVSSVEKLLTPTKEAEIGKKKKDGETFKRTYSRFLQKRLHEGKKRRKKEGSGGGATLKNHMWHGN